MRTKSILTAAAIALVATIGSATAGEQFSALEGIPAVPLTADEQAAVVGAFGNNNTNHGSSFGIRNLDVDSTPAGIGPRVPATKGTAIADALL